MKVLLISYGVKEYDGRLEELYHVAKKVGSVNLVCIGDTISSEADEHVLCLNGSRYLGIRMYWRFIIVSLKVAWRMNKIDILLADNFFASLPALLIKMFFKPQHIIQDVRELYFCKESASFSMKLFCKCESLLMKFADLVICASKQRARIMEKHFCLRERPVVFENIRFLKGGGDSLRMDVEYGNSFHYRVNIVSSGGPSVERGTDRLVLAMTKLPSDFGLFIIGRGTPKDVCMIEKIIAEKQLSNVFLMGRLSHPELRYILQHCDIGIVNYHAKDLNNKYCASGKVYEYLAEGLAIVTTENPSLKELCVREGVGEADDNFFNGLMKVGRDLQRYKSAVSAYMRSISVEENRNRLAGRIVSVVQGSEDIGRGCLFSKQSTRSL